MPLPRFSMPDLPVAECLPRLLEVLGAGSNAVLVAPPGAGKTTSVPLALLGTAPMDRGRILMLEPRRLAARAAAGRMASLIGEKAGQTVGFRTRLESAVSPATRIEVVTTGLLVRRLLGDPGLEGVSAVILDEIHERSLEADLALALCLDAQAMLRPDLRLLAMSATLDGARLSAILNAPIVESAGRMHPVEIRYAARDIPTARDLPEAMGRAIRAALTEAPGDILAFLPGWEKSAARKRRSMGWAPRCYRCTAICRRRHRIWRFGPRKVGVWCWPLRLPKPRLPCPACGSSSTVVSAARRASIRQAA